MNMWAATPTGCGSAERSARQTRPPRRAPAAAPRLPRAAAQNRASCLQGAARTRGAAGADPAPRGGAGRSSTRRSAIRSFPAQRREQAARRRQRACSVAAELEAAYARWEALESRRTARPSGAGGRGPADRSDWAARRRPHPESPARRPARGAFPAVRAWSAARPARRRRRISRWRHPASRPRARS